MVDSKRLRFDFSHFDALTANELAAIESLVNDHIRSNTPIATQLCSLDEAKAKGAMALFGEKYGSSVRMLTMGFDNFSVELCGGTHAKQTGDIGLFKIVADVGIAAGVRRIEALTGAQALAWLQNTDRLLGTVAAQLKTSVDNISEKLNALLQSNKDLTRELQVVKGKLAAYSATEWAAEASDVNGVKVLAKRVEGLDADALLNAVDQLKNKLGAAVVLLVNVEGDKASLVAGVTKIESARYKAGELIADFAKKMGGKGGGRPDMARGACPVTDALDTAIQEVPQWVISQV
jgi:alanyl-tRNA synthetase